RLSSSGHTARAKVKLQLGADRVAPEHVIDFLAAIKKFNQVLNGGLHIAKADLKSAPASAAPAPKPSLRTQLEAVLAATSRTIADAELTGQDASDALCERALVRAYLGQGAEALKDAAMAVSLQSQSSDKLR